MNHYEQLQNEACEDGIEIIEKQFRSNGLKGLYCDGAVAIRSDLTSTQKACVLAEELGHHHTSVGNIIDLEDIRNRKQELQARGWAYNHIIGLTGLIEAYECGCKNRHEIAEYLEVTEEFLSDCIDYYRGKYGVSVQIDDTIIIFLPNLHIGRIV